MKNLDELNNTLMNALDELSDKPVDDEICDVLILNLQKLVEQRHLLLNTLIAEASVEDVTYLQQQVELTQLLKEKASQLMLVRRALLHSTSKNNHQISTYKTINLNR